MFAGLVTPPDPLAPVALAVLLMVAVRAVWAVLSVDAFGARRRNVVATGLVAVAVVVHRAAFVPGNRPFVRVVAEVWEQFDNEYALNEPSVLVWGVLVPAAILALAFRVGMRRPDRPLPLDRWARRLEQRAQRASPRRPGWLTDPWVSGMPGAADGPSRVRGGGASDHRA